MYKRKDNKIGLLGQDQLNDHNRMELLLNENPRVQEIFLYQRLNEEIAENGGNKLRYKDSDLHFKSKQISSSSWAAPEHGLDAFRLQQQATGLATSSPSTLHQGKGSVGARYRKQATGLDSSDLRRSSSASASAIDNSFMNASNNNFNKNNSANTDKRNSTSASDNHHHSARHGLDGPVNHQQAESCNNHGMGHCGGCFIKEMNQQLGAMHKLVQEQNEQMSRLKARCLRSYFQRLHDSSQNSK